MVEKVEAFSKQSLDSFDEMIKLLEVLRKDVLQAHEMLKVERENQFLRRNLIRVVCAMLEGVTYGFKHWLLTICDLGKEPLSLEDRVFLTEVSLTRDKDGSWRCQDRYLKTSENIKRCFKLVAEKMPFEWSPDYSNQTWESLRKSFSVRNRITHPKDALALTVDDEEIKQIHGAASWLFATFNDFSEKALNFAR